MKIFPSFPFPPPVLALLPALILLLAACTSPAPRPSVDRIIHTMASTNFDERRPNLVVLHHTSNGTPEKALSTLTDPSRKVSAHYLVGRDGRIVRLVEEKARAWHAGASWWGGNTDVNSASIGIELDNDGFEPFADAQIDALLWLLADILQRYNIPGANVVAHADIAPERKADPSALFPWKQLAEHGFGLWCEAPLPPAPEGFDLTLALAALGYSPAAPEASRRAFLLRYAGGREAVSDDEAKALAYCLFRAKSERESERYSNPRPISDRASDAEELAPLPQLSVVEYPPERACGTLMMPPLALWFRK